MNNQQIPVLVVSLAQASKRRKFMREQMERQKIDYEFFDAVDGDKLSRAYLSKFKVEEGEQLLERPLSKGELGCVFSHLQVYEKMLAENIERLVVLEDDSQLNADFAALINNLNTSPLQWDLLHLGYWAVLKDAPFFGKNIYPISLWESRLLPATATSTKYRIGPPIASLEGSHTYAITKKGAEELIQQIKNSPVLPSDVRLEINSIKQRFAIAPIPVRQLGGDSIEQHLNPNRNLAFGHLKGRSDLKYRISKFIIKSLRKIHPLAPECWHAAKALRRRIKSTLWLIRSKKFPYNDISS